MNRIDRTERYSFELESSFSWMALSNRMTEITITINERIPESSKVYIRHKSRETRARVLNQVRRNLKPFSVNYHFPGPVDHADNHWSASYMDLFNDILTLALKLITTLTCAPVCKTHFRSARFDYTWWRVPLVRSNSNNFNSKQVLLHWRLTRWFITRDGQIYAFYIIHVDHRRLYLACNDDFCFLSRGYGTT